MKALLILLATSAIYFIGAELDVFERLVLVSLTHPGLLLGDILTLVLASGVTLPLYVALVVWRKHRMRIALDRSTADADNAKRLDMLTGLTNRQSLIEAIDARGSTQELPPSLLVIDLIGMRAINRHHAHNIGDQVLVEVANRIRQASHESDLVARISSAEFAVLLGADRHRKSGERLARHLIETIEVPIQIAHRTLGVRANIGLAPGPERSLEDDALLCAERVLRETTGPGQFRVYDVDTRARIQREDLVRESLKRSIAQDEVEPVFQPIVNLETHRIDGVEVLARWPQCRHRISTFDYILAAEREGSIGVLTDLILAKACRALSQLDADLWMSFNLSAQQFTDADLPDRVLSTLSLYGIETRKFVIEITETAVMEDMHVAERVISTFRDAGVKIALDDFGTGASSLTLLAQLPLDRMKIDQTFVSHIETNTNNAQIVTSMLVLAEGLGLTAVVEGIERPEEHDFLVARGCCYGQGYLYGRPCSAAMLPHRLAIGPDFLRLLDAAG